MLTPVLIKYRHTRETSSSTIMSFDERYTLLLADDPEYLDNKSSKLATGRGYRYRNTLHWAIVTAQSLVILILMLILWSRKTQTNPPQIYSPAQNVIEYTPVRFSMGVGRQTTMYQGEPSDTVDKAWEDLYNDFGVSKIPKAQALQLPNKTVSIPGDEDNYIVALSVFHQLHCLNMIRRALRAGYYRDPATGAIGGVLPEDLPEHIDHCVDNIRQALMCSADISSIVWQWSDAQSTAVPRMDTVHSCKNFDKVVEWAKAHKIEEFNQTIHIHGV
ncbi:hypothetical protein QCA50_004685 [Cerrena zonata]|uniref:Uncharacterized protein n=1 Tax=Cerrena zonata TaxID=2478898 RepID=A0AAW0GP61_9APHY